MKNFIEGFIEGFMAVGAFMLIRFIF